MSYICLQVGQCGNQLGHEFYSVIDRDIRSPGNGVSAESNSDYASGSSERWFRGGVDRGRFSDESRSTARALVIDTERKVVEGLKQKMRKEKGEWKYDSRNFITSTASGGAANNWALGYNVRGPGIAENVTDAVQRECEHCDRVENIICLGSCAGGTGSGVGSYVTELLSDSFPGISLMNMLVLPFKSGEVVTQSYNTLLTIAKLYDTSDGIFLLENDSLHKILQNNLRLRDTSFADINRLAAEQLGSVFQPIGKPQTDVGRNNNVTDILLNLLSHSSYKFLFIKSTPHVPKPSNAFEPIPKWETLNRNIENTFKETNKEAISSGSRHTLFKYSKSVGNVFFYRGLDASSLPSEMPVNQSYSDLVGVPKFRRQFILRNDRRFLNKDRFVTVVSNNSSAGALLDDVISNSWDTFVHNAYVHQYAKYGVENEDILQAFVKAETILKDYKSL